MRLQSSKTDSAFSVHAAPNTWSIVGVQTTDFLSYLGFRRSACHFVATQECYVRWVDQSFDVNADQIAEILLKKLWP